MDDELIRRAQRGDELAFRRLVETYTPVAWRTARALLGDRTAAEDAMQEAWLDAWRGLPRFQLGKPFRPWFLTLVANRCRMAARRRIPPTVTLDEELADGLAGEMTAGTEAGLSDDVDLAAVLVDVPAEQRQVIELRYFADLDLSEIAVVTGLPLGTVKSRLHRGLIFLRARLRGAVAEQVP